MKRVWTQAVLRWLVDRGTMPIDRFHEASARLHGMRFSETLMNDEIAVKAARLADWQLRSPRFRRVLMLLGAESTPAPAALRTALALMRECVREVRLDVSRSTIVAAIVQALLRRDSSGGLARALRRHIPATMPLDPLMARETQRAVEAALVAQLR